jgi:hypothetical protein
MQSTSRGTQSIFYCPRFEIPPTWRTRVAQSYPQALGSLSVASYTSQFYGGSMLTRYNTPSAKLAEAIYTFHTPARSCLSCH